MVDYTAPIAYKDAQQLQPERTLELVAAVLSDLGEIRPAQVEDELPRLCAIVPSGFANMNPASVTVTVLPTSAGTHVSVEGAALEGLIKQHAGSKAARRIADRIRTTAGSAG